jgi:MFS family permease
VISVPDGIRREELEEGHGVTLPAAEGPVPGRSLFAYGGFDKLFLGSLSGKLADRIYQMTLVAAGNVVFALTNSENVLAQVQIWGTIPLFFAYPLLGTLIDSVDRRRLMWGLMALKGVVVFLFLWLLWPVRENTPAEAKAAVASAWWFGLALVCILNLIDSPFGPARASAVPDVAPPEHRGLGASLMATSGLIATLLGTLLGGLAADPRKLGPANTIFIAAALYGVSSLLLMWLPHAVTVPDRKSVV